MDRTQKFNVSFLNFLSASRATLTNEFEKDDPDQDQDFYEPHSGSGLTSPSPRSETRKLGRKGVEDGRRSAPGSGSDTEVDLLGPVRSSRATSAMQISASTRGFVMITRVPRPTRFLCRTDQQNLQAFLDKVEITLRDGLEEFSISTYASSPRTPSSSAQADATSNPVRFGETTEMMYSPEITPPDSPASDLGSDGSTNRAKRGRLRRQPSEKAALMAMTMSEDENSPRRERGGPGKGGGGTNGEGGRSSLRSSRDEKLDGRIQSIFPSSEDSTQDEPNRPLSPESVRLLSS